MPDLHPVFVHFPIALITLYAVLECLRFHAVTSRVDLFHTKAVLIVSGTAGGFVAAVFGLLAARVYTDVDMLRIITVHRTFAFLTISIATLLSIIYIGAWLSRAGANVPHKKLFRRAEHITDSAWMIPLALIILAAVSITGALGGSLVYGADADPFVQLLHKIFVR